MIWQRQWDDPSTFHDALRTEILRREATTPSCLSHNKGGWRSEEDVLEWALDEVHTLHDHIRDAVAEVAPSRRVLPFKFRAWAVVNRDGAYHRRHFHHASTWSGIYYLDPGGDCACTVFETAADPIRIAPVPGLMVVFPSTTWHSVEAHRGNGTRITIAFDAR
jgi:hypothetical protein